MTFRSDRSKRPQPGEEEALFMGGNSWQVDSLTPYAYALAFALTLEETAAPLPVRAGWASFLRRSDPGPGLVREAVLEAHRQGHMHAGKLTPDGLTLALQALSGAALPPLSIHGPFQPHGLSITLLDSGPHVGPGGEA